MNNLAGIILAAGKGSRMKSKSFNKVALLLGGKPMIVHGVELLFKLKLSPIVVVVGFAKESVKKLIKEDVLFAEQKKRLGTANALTVGLKVLPKNISDVLVIQGDDSAFYKKENLENLINLHRQNKNAMTLLTAQVSDSSGLGRIIRDKDGKIISITEEKNASEMQKKINEINPACYIFSINFLNKYLAEVPKDPVSKEFYLVSLLEIAIKNKQKVEDVKGGRTPWRGVNTKGELDAAQKLYSKVNHW